MQVNYGKHKNIVNTLVAILGVAMLFVVLFSAIFVATESIHDCTGEECPICTMIQQCENNLNQLGDGRVTLAISMIVVALLVVATSGIDNYRTYSTLVSNMVRLNN